MSTVATKTAKTSKNTANRYKLGRHQTKFLNKIPKTSPQTQTQLRDIASDLGYGQSYADYMIKGMQKRNFLKCKAGKFQVGDGARITSDN